MNMAKCSTLMWSAAIILAALTTKTYSLECKKVDTKRCMCFNFDSTDVQCPIQDSQINLSVTKKDHITLQCLQGSAPYIDLDIIPNLDISESKVFKMQYCYLNTSFSDILKKFNIQDLNTLAFESMAQEDDEKNITITKDSFENLEHLESLTLCYSTFYFSKDFLANTPNLLTLTLNKNGMSELERYFTYVPKLKMLELSGNQINTLPDGIFENLSNLSRLFLFSNNLTSLSRNMFRGLKTLKLLELSNNHIQSLAEDSFAELHNLVNISLRGNEIKRIYSNTFASSPLLQNIRLGKNVGIVLDDYVFANLTDLRSVELYLNKMELIPENTFRNCIKLQEVTLRDNLLTSLPSNLFENLNSLKILDLSYNRLSSLPEEVFSTVENIQELNLGNNKLTMIPEGLFKYLYNLKRLNLDKNMISFVDLRAFSTQHQTLTYLDMSFNKWNNNYSFPLVVDESPTPLNSLLNVQELIISHNELTEIPSLPSLLSLRKMDLSFNKIDYLPIRTFVHSIRFTFEIDLSHNKIEWVDFQFAELISQQNTELYDAAHYDGGSIVLKLAQNPIVCDCSNYDLIRYNNFKMKEIRTLVNIDQDNLVCLNDNTTKVVDLTLGDIDCPVLKGCPNMCKCSYKPYNTAIIVDCAFSNLTEYPDFNFGFSNTYNQTFLLLSGNNFTKGPSASMTNYTNVTNLDLSRNFIAEMEWIPPHLKELNLRDNLLKNLDSRFVDKLKNATALERVQLKGNPWECNCKSLDLQKYLMQYYHKVNSSDVYCHKAKAQLIKITDLCKVSPYLTILLPIVLAVFLCFAVAFAIYYRYQNEIKVYLFAKNLCLWFVSEEELDKDKTYDVFISYSNLDEAFVTDHLLPELEHGQTPFKVCIHIRDWIPGKYIAEQVVNSVKDSRRTLVVLSNNFLDSVWGKWEFRTAHTEAITEGRARVVVVIYGDLDESKLDDELKTYLKTNTYVKWGDKYFWNKLKYALPHSKNHFYERNKKHAKVMLKIDDKFDLIKNPPSPSTTSTPPITLDPSLLVSKQFSLEKRVEGEAPLLMKQA